MQKNLKEQYEDKKFEDVKDLICLNFIKLLQQKRTKNAQNENEKN